MSKTVSLKVNSHRFVERILGKLFEHAGRALSEAMQNSRRAGATEVRFLVAEDPQERTRSIVHIADNGSGILDWDKLLYVAESGWDACLVQEEDAFGIGFAALLFGCRQLIVQSRGHELRLNQAAAVQREAFALIETKLVPQQGTLLRLEGFALERKCAEAHIREYAAGFALPVFLGKVQLPAPHRLDSTFVDTAVGKVRFEAVGALGAWPQGEVRSYYQGLPIRTPVGHSYEGALASIVIHIDESAYPAKAPDRSGLCDPNGFRQSFLKAAREHWARFLRERFPHTPAAEFVERYWSLAMEVGCADLLDRCPVLPAHLLSRVDGFSFRRAQGDSNFVGVQRSVSRAEIESGQVKLARVPEDEASDDSFAFLTLARLRNWLFVDALPPRHWARAHLVSIDEAIDGQGAMAPCLRVDVSFEEGSRAAFSGLWVDADLCLVDRYAICLVDAADRIVHSVEISQCGLYRDGVIIVPAHETGEFLCRQISDYQDENEYFVESAFDADDAGLQNLIAELRGRSPSATLGKVLSEGQVAAKPGMAGSICIVLFAQPATPWRCGEATHVIELSEAAIADWVGRYPDEAAQLHKIRAALAPLADLLTSPRAVAANMD